LLVGCVAASRRQAWKTAKNWGITPARGRHVVAVIGEETACGKPEDLGCAASWRIDARGRKRISHEFSYRVRAGSSGVTHVGRDRGDGRFGIRRRRGSARADAPAGCSRAGQEGAAETTRQTAGACAASGAAATDAAGPASRRRRTAAANSARLFGL